MQGSIVVFAGSPRPKGYSTFLAKELIKKLEGREIQHSLYQIRKMNIRPCIGCDSCRKENANFCVIDDDMRNIYDEISQCRAIIISSPIYWFSINAQTKAFIDRMYGLHTEKTKILKDKKFGIILSYGDDDPIKSGVINAIRMFEDSFHYTKSELSYLIYHQEEKEHQLTGKINKELDLMIEKITQ